MPTRRALFASLLGTGLALTGDKPMATDLSELFTPSPPGPAQDVRYRQGVVVAWDPLTAENQIDVGGTTLENLPILNTSEALLLAAGDVVGLMAAYSEGGAVSYVVLGRLTVPGTASAATALQALTNYIYSATVPDFGSTTSGTFGDLSPAGPEVTAFIRGSGKALVILGATVFVSVANDANAVLTRQPQMSFAASGANTIAADSDRALALTFAYPAGPGSMGFQASRLVLVEGLSPGDTTFTAKYRSAVNSLGVGWQNRNITVFAL